MITVFPFSSFFVVDRAVGALIGIVVPSRRAESDRDEADALRAGALRFGDDILDRLERLAVTHDDQRAVRAAVGERGKIDALLDRSRQRAARLSDDRRVEVVEKEVERAAIDRERRQHVAASGEREHRDAIARRRRAQPPHLLFHPLQAARTFVLRHHRQRRIEREHHVDAARAHDGPLVAPARSGDGNADERARRRRGAPCANPAERACSPE